MHKIKLTILALFISVVAMAGDNYSVLYKIEKGGKKLGFYESNFAKDGVSSNSYDASNSLEMFSSKKIDFVKDGLKNVEFYKNKKSFKFIVATKLSALDAKLKKKYDRKFRKVKNDEMLL